MAEETHTDGRIPPWMTKVVVTALITVLVSCALAWATGTSTKVAKHGETIAAQDRDLSHMREDIKEIKQDQKEILRLLRR